MLLLFLSTSIKNFIPRCNGLIVSVPIPALLKLMCWNPNPPCDGVRIGGLWKVIRSWVEPLWMGLCALLSKETREIIYPYICQNYTIGIPWTDWQRQPSQYLHLNWIGFIKGIYSLKSLLNDVLSKEVKRKGVGIG